MVEAREPAPVVSLAAVREARAATARQALPFRAWLDDVYRPRVRAVSTSRLVTDLPAGFDLTAAGRILDGLVAYVDALEHRPVPEIARRRADALLLAMGADGTDRLQPWVLRDAIRHAVADRQGFGAAAGADLLGEELLRIHGPELGRFDAAARTRLHRMLDDAAAHLGARDPVLAAPVRWTAARLSLRATRVDAIPFGLDATLRDLAAFDPGLGADARCTTARVLHEHAVDLARAARYAAQAAATRAARDDHEGVGDARLLQAEVECRRGELARALEAFGLARRAYRAADPHPAIDRSTPRPAPVVFEERAAAAIAELHLEAGDPTAAVHVLHDVWVERLARHPQAAGRGGRLAAVSARAADASGEPAAATAFRAAEAIYREGVVPLLDRDPDPRGGPVALGALAQAMERIQALGEAAPHWMAAAYAARAAGPDELARLAIAGYERTAREVQPAPIVRAAVERLRAGLGRPALGRDR